MKSCSLFKTPKQNEYLFDRRMKKTLLCHPLLSYIVKGMCKNPAETVSWIESLKDNSQVSQVKIENGGTFSKEEVGYYYRKCLFLKENGYFSEVDQKKKLSATLNELNVKSLLANGKQVVFEVTEQCQMNCYYCGYGKFYNNYDNREKKNLDISCAKDLLNYLKELWNSPLNTSHDNNIYISFYGGEPLLKFSFIREVVNYVKQLKILHNRFTFNLTTNGILLEKYSDFLYEHDFQVLISLDGDEKCNAYRVLKNGKPTYVKVLENVKALQKKYPDYFARRVNFNAVLHNRNSVSEIYKFVKKKFDKIPDISELNTNGIKEGLKRKFWQTYSNLNESLHQSEDYSVVEKDMFLMAPGIMNVSRFLNFENDFSFVSYKDLINTDGEQRRMPTGTCPPFSKKIFLTANGKILPCERIGHQYGLGSVKQGKVELNFEKIAKKYNTYFDKIRKLCNSCSNSETCMQCIFYLNIEDNTPVCNGFMTARDYSNFLSSLVSYIEDKPELYLRLSKEAFVE